MNNKQMSDSELNKNISDEIVHRVTEVIEYANGIAFFQDELRDESNGLFDVGDQTSIRSRIEDANTGAKDAKNLAEAGKDLPKPKWYTHGRQIKITDNIHESLKMLSDSQESITEAMKYFFNQNIKLAKTSQYLIGIGVLNIAANRMVVREIALRLQNASKEEISDLARKELETVLKQLKAQQDIYDKVENHSKLISEQDRKIDTAQGAIDFLQADFADYKSAIDRQLADSKKMQDSRNRIIITISSIVAVISIISVVLTLCL
jgi:hypothetical protein